MSYKFPPKPKILITRTDRIGDLVVSTPIFEEIKKSFPESYLAVCIFSDHRELVEGNPFVDEVILYEKKASQKSWLGQWFFSQDIKKKEFDLVIHLHATNRMHIMSWLANIPVRIGYDRRASWALTHAHRYDKKEGLMHESEYLAKFCEQALSQLSSKPQEFDLGFPLVSVSKKNTLSVLNLLEHYGMNDGKPFAVIHPSASDVSKMWSAEKFSDFLKTMALATDIRWISVGDENAERMTKEIVMQSGIQVTNLCNQLSLGMLAALFKEAKLVVSNDSGPAHIAAAVDTPTVSIFGRWQPGLNAKRWQLRGKRVATVKPQIEDVAEEERKFSYIHEISVEHVFKACELLLK